MSAGFFMGIFQLLFRFSPFFLSDMSLAVVF